MNEFHEWLEREAKSWRERATEQFRVAQMYMSVPEVEKALMWGVKANTFEFVLEEWTRRNPNE